MKPDVTTNLEAPATARPIHPWLRRINVAFVPGPATPLSGKVAEELLRYFRLAGHRTLATPNDLTDIILTTARFGEPVGWRKAPLLSARRSYRLKHSPDSYTLVHVSRAQFQASMAHFRSALQKEPPDPQDYAFPGLAPQAHRVLYEQGRRGGPILSLMRLVQAQVKSIRVLLVVGDERPLEAYHFDLVGAHPRTDGQDLDAFYGDIVLRMVTTTSTVAVSQHQVLDGLIPDSVWQRLTTPAAMQVAGRELGKRSFFTEMIRIPDLVSVPSVGDAVASQYSEGCFATWDADLGALIATVTGSARPVDKSSITPDDLAVIVGVRPDAKGALVRHVEGRRNAPPSSEAVEMIDMDGALPRLVLDSAWAVSARVPAVRSKLHGHRGIGFYDPAWVEYAPMEPAYFNYLVSCGSNAQAQGIKSAFARAESLQIPEDPRMVAFTVLPGHGVFIVEKWVPGTVPFQTIWEYMDAGYLRVEDRIPQGPMGYVAGKLCLKSE